MIRVLASILLIISMVALSHVAVKKTSARVEASLLSQATVALREKGLLNISASIDGRDLALGGVVYQDEDRRVAGDVVAKIAGLHSITNRIQIRRVPANEVAAVKIGTNRPAAIRPTTPAAAVKPRVPMIKPAPTQQPDAPAFKPPPAAARPAPVIRPAPTAAPVIPPPPRPAIKPKPVVRPIAAPVAPRPAARPPVVKPNITQPRAADFPTADQIPQLQGPQLQASGITPSPYTFSLRKVGSRIISNGYLPDNAALAAVTSQVSLGKKFAVKQAAGAPSGFDAAARFAAMAVSKLDTGSVTISDRQIAIKGSVKGQANDFLDQIEPTLPNGYNYTVDLNSPMNAQPKPSMVSSPMPSPQPAPMSSQPQVARMEPVIVEAQTVSAEQLRNESANCQASIDTYMSGRNIAFDFGRADINSSSRQLLDEITAIMFECPAAYLAVTGHTDSRGSGERNRIVSQERADAVRSYLVNAGLYANNIAAIGRGAAQPIADNGSADGRARNRRIEFSVSSEPN